MMLASASPISLASAAVGLSAVAAIYALHLLRVRPNRRPVATLIFWSESLRRQTAKTLWSPKLSQWLAFALLSTIALLLAAVLSAGRWGVGSGGINVFVVDSGASMAAPLAAGQTVLDVARTAVETDASQLSAAPALILAGDQPALICDAGLPIAIFQGRLANVTASAGASNAVLALQLADSMLSADSGAIIWYTDQQSLPQGLPAEIAGRVQIRRQSLPAEAVAIIGATYEPSLDSPYTGTLHVKLAGSSGRGLTVTAALGAVKVSRQIDVVAAGGRDVLFEAMPADGALVKITLDGAPGSPYTHSTEFRLPQQTPLKFYLAGSIPGSLRSVLTAMGSIEATPEGCVMVVGPDVAIPANAQEVIKLVGEGPPSANAALLMVPPSANAQFENLDFESAMVAPLHHGELASDAAPLLRAGEETVAARADDGAQRRMYLDGGLFDDASTLPRRAAFPVFMYRIACETAGWKPATIATTVLRRADDPLWNRSSGGTSVAYERPALASDAGKSPNPDAEAHPAMIAPRRLPWADILLAVVLLLVMVEGVLLARKRIA